MSVKKKVLVVDDNQSYVDFIRDALGEAYEISAAEGGEAGLKALSASQPDLILLDVNMPGMNGVEFVRQLARTPAISAIPVIVITASDYNSITASLLKNEPSVKFFLTKLSPVEVVVEKINEVLGTGEK